MTARKYLTIPTDPETHIPLGMSQSDYDLMKATVDLWEKRICPTLEKYDENNIEQRFDDPAGAESTSFERELEDDEKLEAARKGPQNASVEARQK